MRRQGVLSEAPEDTGWGRGGGPGVLGYRPSVFLAVVLAAVAVLVAGLLSLPAGSAAAAADNPYQRGPDPTLSSVAATRGPFATAQTSVGGGFGFKDATIYYPTDTGQGTWGAVAIVPGYTAQFANEEAWMGPWLSSFGFVVIGIDTNSPDDYDTQRGTQLLAALDYLTAKSPVRGRVDPNRLSVIGHSMGGGGVVYASEHRPSLKAAVGLAPFSPSQTMATDTVPTMVMGGQKDPTVTPSYLDGLLAKLPASTQSDFVQIAGADHLYYTKANSNELRIVIPWLKIFVDNDTRYSQFLCPTLADSSGISIYRSKCPYTPPGSATGGSTTGGTTTGTTDGGTTTGTTTGGNTGAGCTATYSTVNSWSGGFQGEVKVTAGPAAVNGWSVRWGLGSGQSISQVWNGTLSTSGSDATVTNATYNGSLPASGSTTFGFLADGTPAAPSLTCTTS